MNYTVSGIFSVQVKAANRADAKEIAEKMLRTSSKVRFCIIEIEEGEPSERGVLENRECHFHSVGTQAE